LKEIASRCSGAKVMKMDAIGKLKKNSIAALREYKSLDRQITRLIDEFMRLDWSDPRRAQLEKEKQVLVRKKADLSGGPIDY
jgi:hypothetical protein